MHRTKTFPVTAAIALAITASTLMNASAQTANPPLSAAESDPKVMGWMQGFPPPPDKVLSVADGSFFQFPAMRYSVNHMREFLPTTVVSRGNKQQIPLKYALDKNIDTLVFTPTGADKPMTFADSLPLNYTDGIVILHRGRIVYERYFGGLSAQGKHAAMSVTKSFTGTLASILVSQGKLDPSKMVTDYVPELKDSAFGDATVRQVMDMTTALKFSEDYANPAAEIWQYSAAGNPLSAGDGPKGYLQGLQAVQKEGEHGEAFDYKTPNADALGLIVSRASGKSVAQLLSEQIWTRIGMEQDAYYQVDGLGTPFAGGGISLGLRDMARFGDLVRNQGRWRGAQIFPVAATQDIAKGGSLDAFVKSGHPALPGWSYRDMWWNTMNADGAYAARGVHGQAIYIDPKAEMVLVRFASHPVAGNAANDPTSLPAYQAVADHLMKRK